MPAKTNKPEATAAAAVAPAKRPHLAYNLPWTIFYPLALLFILVNYLAFGTRTDETGTRRLLPPYLASYAASRDYMREAAASGTSPAEDSTMNALLLFEESVMGLLFDFGMHVFRSIFGIQIVCIVAWMIHIFELGISFRICVSCNATVPTTVMYMACTALAGFSQLVPQMEARDAWVAEVKALEGETVDGAAAKESKKQK